MKFNIKLDELKNELGNVIKVTEDIYGNYPPDSKEKELELPKGDYLLIEIDQYGDHWFYDINRNRNVTATFEFVPYEEYDSVITSFYVPPTEVIQYYIEKKKKKILELQADGWVIYDPETPEENKILDLKPYINQLKTLKELQNIIATVQGKDEQTI